MPMHLYLAVCLATFKFINYKPKICAIPNSIVKIVPPVSYLSFLFFSFV